MPTYDSGTKQRYTDKTAVVPDVTPSGRSELEDTQGWQSAVGKYHLLLLAWLVFALLRMNWYVLRSTVLYGLQDMYACIFIYFIFYHYFHFPA